MFIPNTFAMVYTRRSYNLYGEPDFNRPIKVPCGIVKLDVVADKTSVRTDSSASRGNADELTTQTRMLFSPGYGIGIGDKVDFEGILMVITEAFARRDMSGQVDHLDCVLQKWTEP